MGIAGTRPSSRISFAFCALLPLAGVFAQAQKVRYSGIHREGERVLPLTVTGGTAALRAKIAAGTGASLVVADFDSDGTQDIVSGYATSTGGALLLQRGSPVALAPTPNEWAMQAAGQLVAPYVAKAEPIELPVRPDLLKSADIGGHGFADLIAAQKGDTSLYLAIGDGRGNFAAVTPIPLAGRIGSLATWRARSGDNLLVAGVCGDQGCGLQFLARDGATRAFVHTPGPVGAIETGSIDIGGSLDFALIAGGKVLVLDGDTALGSSPILETLPVGGAVAIALGTFVPDHHPGLQIAVLDSGATLHVITRQGIDASYNPEVRRAQQRAAFARQTAKSYTLPTIVHDAKRTGLPWIEAETVAGLGSGGHAVMFRARLTGGGNDDLAILGGSQYITVAHPLVREDALFTTTPVVTFDSTSSPIAAALPARLGADARLGIVTLGKTGPHPLTVTPPATNKTLNVNTTADATPTSTSENLCINNAAGCTLRSALTVANLDRAANGESEVDTINLPAGTYTLSAVNTNSNGQTQNPDYLGSANYHLEIEASVNLIGAGSASTIINANNVDMTIAVDFGSFYATKAGDFESAPLDAFLSGVTIENGKNTTNITMSGPCYASGDCNDASGNMTWEVEGASNLVMNHVVLTSGNSPNSGGGAIYVTFDSGSTGTAGPLEIDNSTLSSNKASYPNGEGGGGIDLSVENGAAYATPMVLTSDVISSNTSPSFGGGVYVEYTTGQIAITNTTIGNNTALDSEYAYDAGGGGFMVYAPLTMAGSTISGNSSGAFGAGGYIQGYNFTQSITTSTFTTNANTASLPAGTRPDNEDGAGLCLESSYNDVTNSNVNSIYSVTYSRFHGNTGGNSTGLAVGCSSDTTSSQATVTATDDWWGCNPTTATNISGDNNTAHAIAGTGCDTAGLGNVTVGSLTVTPYTTLTLGLSSTSVTLGSSVTATASLGQNSGGTTFFAANDPAFVATPIGTFTLTDTGTVSYNPSSTAFSSSAAATATGTTNSSGTGTATLTVDGTTLTKTYTIINPPDLTVTSAHTGNFKAGDTGDAYILTASNSGGSSTSGTVTVIDTLPNSGFVATALSGSGWTCTLSSLTCTRSDALAASASYPPIALTESVASTEIGTYSNVVNVSGGGETNTSNDSYSDATIVVGPPTIAEAFSPTQIAPSASSVVTFSLTNPSGNVIALTNVSFSDTLPTNLKVASPNGVTQSSGCMSGGTTANSGASSIMVSGMTVASGATCTITVSVTSSVAGTYTNTTSTVTAGNSNPGGTASATLTVTDATTTTVSLGSTTGTVGTSTSMAAVVSDTSTPANSPAGTVTFYNTVNGATTTIGTYTLTSGSVSTTYPESYGGSNVITATYTPATVAYAASSDNTGKTITVAKASPPQTTGALNQTISRNVASEIAFIINYPGAVHPTGAITVQLNGTTISTNPTCVYKSFGPHSNCSFTYTTSLADGNYTLTYTQAADSNYNGISGSSTITVIN